MRRHSGRTNHNKSFSTIYSRNKTKRHTHQQSQILPPATLAKLFIQTIHWIGRGILSVVSQNHFKLESTTEHNFTLSSIVTSTTNNRKLHITNVYAPMDHQLKKDFLLEMAQITPQSDIPWMILGDLTSCDIRSRKTTTPFAKMKPMPLTKPLTIWG
jgi:hypothetical protein